MELRLEDNDYCSPKSIMYLYNNALKVREEKIQIYLQGMYKQTGTKLYDNKCYYDTVVDENTEYRMVLVVSELLRKKLKDGFIYKFKGYLNRKVVKDGRIQISYYVFEIIGESGKLITEEQYKAFNVREVKANMGYKELDQNLKEIIYNKDKARIALIMGNNSIIENDILQAMEESVVAYDIDKYRISLSSKNEIIESIEKINNEEYDAVVLSRGGGEGLEIFDDPDIAQKTLEIKSPFVSAIGHADDKTLIQEIADKKFNTPTSLGEYLKDIYNEVLENKRKKMEERQEYEYRIDNLNQKNSKLELSMEELRQKLSNDIKNLQNENQEAKNKLYIFIIASFIIGFIISRFIK